MKRRILIIEATNRKWYLQTIDTDKEDGNTREDFFIYSGETLCQNLLRKDPQSMVIARGPLPYSSGNKTSIGYISPLTQFPHYSFVGGNSSLHLFGLGLDAIWFRAPYNEQGIMIPYEYYISIRGKTPEIALEYVSTEDLPRGQRSLYYKLLEQETNGDPQAASIFTVGSGAYRNFTSSNLAAEGIYHAGRGGAGHVFAKFLRALVLKSEPGDMETFFNSIGETSFLHTKLGHAIDTLLDTHCKRLSAATGGTIAKLYATGMNEEGINTLPSFNAQKLGYSQADLGSPVILKALRKGKTACAWCKVACRHFHYIKAEYAPEGRDIFLDDFEPTYAIYAMLGLTPVENSLAGKLGLFDEINNSVIKPIEEMGLDIINTGIALAALCEGIEKKIIPPGDIPESLKGKKLLGNKDAIIEIMTLLADKKADTSPALLAVGSGPEALVELYPDMRDIVFTCGKGTLGNPGHCNTLWTFLMPFSRYFGHYVGQIYKIEDKLPAHGAKDIEYIECFKRVINTMLQREYYWIIGNALSQCSFTFIIFSEDAKGEKLRKDSLLPRLLSHYGIKTTNEDLEWFSQAFWAQSMYLKYNMGWRPPSHESFPLRVYEALGIALHRDPGEIKRLMGMLIGIWKEKTRMVLARFGYTIPWI